MGKAELFEGRKGRLLLALGGFPVKRGESDAEALDTAQPCSVAATSWPCFPRAPASVTLKPSALRSAVRLGWPSRPVLP